MSDAPDPSELARRYLDLWQQHLLQTANNPELTATLAKLAELALVFPGVSWPAAQPTSDRDDTQGSASSASSSHGSGDDIGDLRRRLAGAEKRLDALERQNEGARKRAAKGSGKRRS